MLTIVMCDYHFATQLGLMADAGGVDDDLKSRLAAAYTGLVQLASCVFTHGSEAEAWGLKTMETVGSLCQMIWSYGSLKMWCDESSVFR